MNLSRVQKSHFDIENISAQELEELRAREQEENIDFGEFVLKIGKRGDVYK